MFWPLFFLTALLGLASVRARLRTASLVLGASVLFYGMFGDSGSIFLLLALLCVVVLVPLNVPALRQEWLSRPAFVAFRRLLQSLYPEALAALDAGRAGWDAGLLGGELDWARIEALPPAQPGAQEQALIATLLADFRRLCAEQTALEARLRHLRVRGWFGLGIAPEHGGLGLSALGRSAALMQLAAFDAQAAAAVGASGRLTWIELLQRHGLHAQQARWLPGLAGDRDRIARVCDPLAGIAIAVHTQVDGESTIGLRLRLNAALADDGAGTLLAMLVQVQDPSSLLDPAARGGPTCLLLPRDTAGLRAAGTLDGEALVLADDVIVGGSSRIGRGAVDLQAAAALASAASLPAVHAGVAATAALAAGAFARSHAPFTEPTGARATAQEALAAIGALSYASAAVAAAAAQSSGEGIPQLSPAAFARSFAVEQSRRISAAAADLGLADSSLRHLLDFDAAHNSCATPPRLTRSLDYTACVLSGHAGFMAALGAARDPSPARGLVAFDAALRAHFGHTLASGSRALVLALSGGLLSNARMRAPLARRLGQRINRYSAALAFTADVALSRIGLDLASKRSFTARRSAHEAARLTLTTWLGDALAQLWLATCALKRFDDAGAPVADRAVLQWVCADALRSAAESLDQVLRHLSSPSLALLTRLLIFPLGRGALAPRDAANHQVAQQLLDGERLRQALAPPDPPLAVLAAALNATLDGEMLESRAEAAAPGPVAARIEQALARGLIDPAQAQQLLDWLYAVRRLEQP